MSERDRFEFTKKDGLYVGSSGCQYDTKSEAMYYDQIGLCGCGNPSEVHGFLIRCLSAVLDDAPNIIDAKKVRKEIEENPDIVTEFVLHFLDSCCLTEHGVSVFGSWLTDRGKQFVELGPHDDDDDE